VRVDPHRARVLRRIVTPLPPVAVAPGARDVWIAGQSGNGAPDALLHYDLKGRLLGRIDVAQGVAALVRGGGALWASERREAHVLRVDLHTGETQTWGEFRTPALALAYGAGHVWASLRDSDTVVRMHPRTGQTVATATQRQPEQLIVAAGQVYVACSVDHVVMAIDPRSMRPSGEAQIRFNPYALAAGEGHVWVTDVGANTVSRLDS
jgi:hypothetical protein